jgi:hypothetical protein
MTDTKIFTCTAIDRSTGQAKTFFSLIPGKAHKLALGWLQDRK